MLLLATLERARAYATRRLSRIVEMGWRLLRRYVCHWEINGSSAPSNFDKNLGL